MLELFLFSRINSDPQSVTFYELPDYRLQYVDVFTCSDPNHDLIYLSC